MANRIGDYRDNDLNGTGGADTFFGRSGDDTLNGRGGDDFISGGSGDDYLEGHGGEDSLFGGSGDDFLIGGHGPDLLLAGSGDDSLEGGWGPDIMSGGDGKDRFTFARADGSFRDGIVDYQPGLDEIILEGFGSQPRITATAMPGGLLVNLPGGGEIGLVGITSLDDIDFTFTS